jgi:hypothetical protein
MATFNEKPLGFARGFFHLFLCFTFAFPFCERREFEVARNDPERRRQMRTKRFAKQEDARVPPLPVVKNAYLKG